MFSPAFRLHHVGVLVKDIEKESRLYRDRFGYKMESGVIEDAGQTAFGLFLRQNREPYWLELVAPNGPESKLANALNQGGGGPHHFCYEVADMEASCEHLQSLSMIMLSPPTPGTAFGGRRIAWLAGQGRLLVELLESGPGPLSLAALGVNPSEGDAREGH